MSCVFSCIFFSIFCLLYRLFVYICSINQTNNRKNKIKTTKNQTTMTNQRQKTYSQRLTAAKRWAVGFACGAGFCLLLLVVSIADYNTMEARATAAEKELKEARSTCERLSDSIMVMDMHLAERGIAL